MTYTSVYRPFNLNNNVKVKITPLGQSIREKFYASYGIKARPLDKDSEGFTEMQLWQVMQIFGEHMHFGLPEQPISCHILIEDKP